MKYLTTVELSERWGISSRRIGMLCTEGRIDGVIKKGKTWLILSDAQRPEDARVKTGKYIKEKGE
ncbi:MAG: DNA-binding protein [Lachnospiraceae bacterium]